MTQPVLRRREELSSGRSTLATGCSTLEYTKGNVMKRCIVLFFVMVVTWVWTGCQMAGPPATLRLSWAGSVSLTEEQRDSLHESVSALLATSQFNSVGHPKILTLGNAEIQKQYDDTLSGEHLAVTYPRPKIVTTMGGEVSVLKIVVGLGRDDYASPLLTIDGAGAVVAHGKYNGGMCIALLDEVRQLVENGFD